MKSVGLIFKILLVVLALSGLKSKTNAQSETPKGNVLNASLIRDLPANGELIINNYDAELEIKVWNNPKVEIKSELIVEVDSQEDLIKLAKAFAIKVVDEKKDRLSIDTKFYKSMVSMFGKKTTLELITGEKITVKKIVKASHIAYIPQSANLQIISKYNKLNIENISGNIKLNLYDVDIYMGNFGSTGNFDMKYSKANIGNGGNSTFMLYDTDIDAGELGNVKVDAKYSKLIIKKTNDLSIVSYDDDFVVGQLSKITADAKYSTFRLNGDTGDSKFELYDSDIFGKNFKSISFSAKYSDLRIGDIGELIIPSSYDNNYYLGVVGSLNCSESKYDMFRLDGANGSLDFPNTYDADILIKNTSANFKGLSGKFTYGKVYLKLDNSQQFNLNFSSTYGNITFPTDKFKIKSLSDKTDSKRIFEGSTAADAKCNIKFTSYDTNFIIE